MVFIDEDGPRELSKERIVTIALPPPGCAGVVLLYTKPLMENSIKHTLIMD
mgnify:CR=1 FL=1